MTVTYQLILGNYIHPINDKSCEFVKEGALLLQREHAKAPWLFLKRGKESALRNFLKSEGIKRSQIKERNFRQHLMIPGLLDLHFHWVQDDVRLMPKDSLLDWLKNYTWPYEKKFASASFAKKRSKRMAKELAQVGTLGGACYASLHPHTVDEALKHFRGAFRVGNVQMTMNSPEGLVTSEGEALQEAKKLAKRFGENYIFTPRFAPSTGPQLMKEGGKLSEKYGCWIQSHLSETRQECEFVLETFRQFPGFENVQSYTEVYDRCGLLGPKTIMGHGIYLAAKEWKRLAETQTAIAHCPTSNAPVREQGLGSGLFDFRRAEKEGVRWGLGTDIGAGPYLSLLDVMRSFVEQNQKRGIEKANYVKALYRAAQANAEILGLGERMGDFSPGKEANFLVLANPGQRLSNDPEKVLKKICHRPLKRRSELQNAVLATFWQGQKIYGIKEG